MANEAEQVKAARGTTPAGAGAKSLSPEDTVNLEGVEEALRTSWRTPRAVDLFPEEPEAMAPSEEFKLTSEGRRKRIGEIFQIVRKYEAWHDITPRRLCLLYTSYSTSGSAPRTRSLLVMVSVALMPTSAVLKPAAAQMP